MIPIGPARLGRVYVVDDDPRLVVAVRRVLERAGHQVVEFTSPAAFLAAGGAKAPSCVLLDLEMPDLKGLDVQAALRRMTPDAAVVFMTAHGDVPSSVGAMKAGASDFLTKPVPAEVLLAAVEVGLRRSERQQARHAVREDAQERIGRLTRRERDVAELLVQGLKNRVIGDRLGVTEKTVKAHRGRVLERTSAGSLTGLVRIVDAAGEEEWP